MAMASSQKENTADPALKTISQNIHMSSDNKVRELATMCLPRQHQKKALVWFDDADI